MLALAAVEKDIDPETGHPRSEVMDPANQFAYVGSGPEMNWAAKALDDYKKSYYEPLDAAAKAAKLPPVSRAGHRFHVSKRNN